MDRSRSSRDTRKQTDGRRTPSHTEITASSTAQREACTGKQQVEEYRVKVEMPPVKKKIPLNAIRNEIQAMERLPQDQQAQQAQKCRELLANVNTQIEKCNSRDDRGINFERATDFKHRIETFAERNQIDLDLDEKRQRAWWAQLKF